MVIADVLFYWSKMWQSNWIFKKNIFKSTFFWYIVHAILGGILISIKYDKLTCSADSRVTWIKCSKSIKATKQRRKKRREYLLVIVQGIDNTGINWSERNFFFWMRKNNYGEYRYPVLNTDGEKSLFWNVCVHW